MTDETNRGAFERYWVSTRGAKKAAHELQRHPAQPQTYVQDSANRHWVTWQAAQQQAEPVHGDIRALKYRIHELEGEVLGYKQMLDVAEAAPQRNPLTDEEIDQLLPEIVSGGSFTVVTYGRAVARAIEAKLKEKNSD